MERSLFIPSAEEYSQKRKDPEHVTIRKSGEPVLPGDRSRAGQRLRVAEGL